MAPSQEDLLKDVIRIRMYISLLETAKHIQTQIVATIAQMRPFLPLQCSISDLDDITELSL